MKLSKFVPTSIFWGSALTLSAFSLRVVRGLEFSGIPLQSLGFINLDWIVNLEHFITAIGCCLFVVGTLSSVLLIKGKKDPVRACNYILRAIMLLVPLAYLVFSFCWEFNIGLAFSKGSTTNQFLFDLLGILFTLALLAALRVRYEPSGDSILPRVGV
jgi:cytochrome bd-type quinol oxidase subunit 2